MEWLKKAPTAVTVTAIVVFGIVALGVLGVFTALTLSGADTAEFRTWVNTIANLVVLPGVGLTAVASTVAARSASRAEEQTNGHLTQRDENIAALRAQVHGLQEVLADREDRLRRLGAMPTEGDLL